MKTKEQFVTELIKEILSRRSETLQLSQAIYAKTHTPDARCVGQIDAYSQVLSMIDSMISGVERGECDDVY